MPNLNFSKVVSNVYFHVDYDIIEQRSDGFRISVTSSQSNAAIEWVAVGITDKIIGKQKERSDADKE